MAYAFGSKDSNPKSYHQEGQHIHKWDVGTTNLNIEFERTKINFFLFGLVSKHSLPKPFIRKHLIRSLSEMERFNTFCNLFQRDVSLSTKDYFLLYIKNYGFTRKKLKFLQIKMFMQGRVINVYPIYNKIEKVHQNKIAKKEKYLSSEQ